MKQNKPFDALFDADDQTISRIAAQCEPDWDENELFERSYRKYQAKRSGKILRIPRRIEHEPLRAIVTAACLMIAIGGAGSIWFFRYGVQKPDMTVELEAAPTEQTTSAETTTVTAVQTETAAASAATTRPETVYLVPEEAMELHTTAPATTLVPASSATKAVTSAVTASRTTAAASTVPTAQQSTAAVTVGAPGTVSRQETQTVPAQRPSAQTTAAKTSETAAAPVQTTTAKHEDAAAAATETFPAPGSGDSPTPAEPVGDMEEPAPVEGGDLPANPIEPVSGGTAGANGRFTFQEENGWSKVTFTADRVIAVDKVKVTSTLDSYVLEELDSHDTYSRLFQIKDPVTGDNCQIRHRSYDGFSGSFKIDEMELKEVTINGRPGYLMWVTGQTHTDPDGNDNLYTLFWDDGTGISMISDVDAGGKNMIKIAESIITTTE